MSIIDRFKKQEEAPEKASVAKKVVEASDDKKPAKAKKAGVKKATKKSEKKVATVSKKSLETLLGPVVTEKSAKLSEQGVVVFQVAKNANRVAVRNAFREIYKVTPVRVNIVNSRGENMRFGRIEGKRKDTKKALIKLPNGVKVDIFEGV